MKERVRHDVSIVGRMMLESATVGDVVAGKYRLVRSLGTGAMGRVFAAEHLGLGTRVALKFMSPRLASDESARARFAHEAFLAANLTSRFTARVRDVDHLASGELFMVMDHLEGRSLDAVLAQSGPLAVADAVTYALQTCEALAEAHANGIVHRDVKPSNLFLVRGPTGAVEIRLLDFGLATSVAVDTAALDGALAVGTPAYMSPEQIRAARNIDGRTDVWSLGATLHELLVGRPPHEGRGALTVFSAILQGRRASVGTLRSDVPRSLEAIVEQCLAIDRAARFASVDALARALRSTLAELREGVRELPLRALRPRRAAGA